LSDSSKTVLAYADGSCIGNPGPGGWGVVIIRPDGSLPEEVSGRCASTTNNRMEITAAIEALRRIEPRTAIVLRSDSEYVVNTMNKKWNRRANRELWKELDAEVARRRVKFEWVRGHADDPLNMRADELAREAAEHAAAQAPAPAQAPPSPALEADERLARELEPMLRAGETIRACAGCGRKFVAKVARYCTRLECQLKARRAAATN
jgi:ribonuclease HI